LIPLLAAVLITLDQAIALALQHNHNLLAARTTVEQSLAQEVTAGLRPNPVLSADVGGLSLFKAEQGSYIGAAGADIGLSYTFELGGKRGNRIKAAKDATAVTQSQVSDNERSLTFQVASQFINVQLAESALDLAQENLKSFERAVEIGEARFRAGGMSENDFLKIKLQLLQFQVDAQQAQLARVQALSDLRQLVGYESVPPDYDVSGAFEYQAVTVQLEGLQKIASERRPDLRAAKQGADAAWSQHALAKSNGWQDLTVSGTYSRSNFEGGTDTAAIGVSIPLGIFDRNQGEIERTRIAIVQAQQQLAEVSGQVLTDVKDAFENLQRSNRIIQYYRSGYLDVSQKSRDISEYAYRRGAVSLFDFLDAERTYRATQIGYRQALADYLVALEQVRQSVGTRALQ
jgi:cobalt-zinc-cadmium efflux system outer membrane protein